MEDKIIQSKFMKDYKAIFRDSVGSGKHGKWLKKSIHGKAMDYLNVSGNKIFFFFLGGGGEGGAYLG